MNKSKRSLLKVALYKSKKCNNVLETDRLEALLNNITVKEETFKVILSKKISNVSICFVDRIDLNITILDSIVNSLEDNYTVKLISGASITNDDRFNPIEGWKSLSNPYEMFEFIINRLGELKVYCELTVYNNKSKKLLKLYNTEKVIINA